MRSQLPESRLLQLYSYLLFFTDDKVIAVVVIVFYAVFIARLLSDGKRN